MSNAARANDALRAGKQITKGVSLVSPLSSGGMGAVWLADHQGLKTRVVVKFMLEDLGASEGARSRFSREAAAAAQVKSPHVVQMLDHGVSEDGVPFIVMEHLEGHDLGDEIRQNGALDPAKVIAIVAQVAKALTKVHAAGLLHRDIKPDNIFLVDTPDDEDYGVFVKLLDFGIAKTAVHEGEPAPLDSETKTGQIVGTPFYMSPEQVTAQKTIDLRSDVWALGVVAYEALTGKRPFDGPSFGALAVKIATGSPPKPTEANPALPPALDGWFAKACAQDPQNRFASAKELADGLRGAFEGIVSLPSPISGDSGARSSPSQPTALATGGNLPFAKTALDESSPRNEALARSEAGVSVHSQAQSQRSSLLLLGALVFVAVVAIAFNFMRKTETPPAPTPANSGHTEPAATSAVTPPVTPAPVVSVITVYVEAGAPAPGIATAATTNKPIFVPAPPPPRPSTKPPEDPQPKPKPSGGDILY